MSPQLPCIWPQQSCSIRLIVGVAAQASTGSIMTSMTKTAAKLAIRRIS
jgi:hypothetical protein